jgi:glycosyltransferase involved in cell wall biosynthesis
MKILLLTDIPPCQNFTAGLVLAQLCRFLPRGSLACFTILNPHLKPEFCSDLDWIPTEIIAKPDEFGRYWPLPRPYGIVTALPIENYRRLVLAPWLRMQAARFARAQNVDMIWAVLQGQTMIRVAGKLATNLGLPLVTQVWDPLGWWLRAHGVDRWNRRVARRQFDKTIRQSVSCITASWAMAEEYETTYGVRAIPVISSLCVNSAASPPPRLRNEHEFVIGMAGQFYASDAWANLLSALDYAGWQVAGRSVRLKVLGSHPPPTGVLKNTDYLGWKSPEEAIQILAKETDVLYCPYPFAPTMEEVARMSFPSKLPLYFAAGRPVVFHGPADSSPARYLVESRAGVLCTELAPAAIYNELERLVISPTLYAQTVHNARAASERDFTLERMRDQFFAALGITAQGPELPASTEPITNSISRDG